MKIQKACLIAILALGSLVALTTTSLAQDAKEGKKGGRSAAIQERIDKMATELKLTDDQKTKVTALFESQGKKRQELRNLSQDERREKVKAMNDEQVKKMKEILTPEQFEKWQKMRHEARQRRGGGGANSG